MQVTAAPASTARPSGPLATDAPVAKDGPAAKQELAEDGPGAEQELCEQCQAPLTAADIFCPECGFVRHRAGATSRAHDTAALDPFPWGLPRPPARDAVAPAVTPAPAMPAPVAVAQQAPQLPASSQPAPDPTAEGDLESTRIVGREPRGERFVLQFSTGESVSVTGTGLIGRNPVAEPGEYFDSIVTIVDPGKSVSKTHLEFGQEGGSFWISDRFSGNGTLARPPESEPRRCDAGKRYRIARGTRVDIGEQFFIVS
jgi:hypothetical protein